MNSEWQAFLISQSARIDEQGQVHFPGSPDAAGCALVDLSHLGLIEVKGPDAVGFLQGQLTNDVRELSQEHTQLSGYCSPKGRMLACFRMMHLGDSYLLQLPLTKLPIILQRLRLFVLRARVTLEDASDRVARMGVAGDCAEDLLRERFGQLPALHNNVVHKGSITLIRMPGATPRFELLGPPAPLAAEWARLAAHTIPVDAAYWSLLEIRAGIPSVYPETTDAFVPQMANMQLIDGVSFTKGCYTGQEVVARMQYLGRLKRRMYLAEVTASAAPRPGDELFSSQSESGQGAGKVVDVQKTDGDRYELLAVVEVNAAEGGAVCLGEDGPELRFRPLPYPFPPEKESAAH